MTFIDKIILGIIMLFAPLYSRLGADTNKLRAILLAKLTIDNRRVSSFARNSSAKEGGVNKAGIGTFVGSAFMGLLFLFGFFISKDVRLAFTIYYSMFIIVLAIMLISDFTSVLIDVRDNYIILPKAVNDATFVLARLLHILARITLIVFPMIIPAMIYTIVVYPIAVLPAFIYGTLVSVVLAVFLINSVYLIILRLTTPQKFQSFITYIQIFFAIFIYASYQIIPRFAEKISLDGIDISSYLWIKFFPPYWFAELCNISGNTIYEWITFFVLSIIFPTIFIYVIVKIFAPSFNRKLSMLSGSVAEQKSSAKDGEGDKRGTKGSILNTIAARITSKHIEKESFLFTWRMTSRVREFKLAVYPALGYIIVMFVMLFIKKGSVDSIMQSLGENLPFVIIVFYISSFFFIVAISNVPYYEKYTASWIFYKASITEPGLIISGAYKALLVKFMAPISIILSIFILIVYGTTSIANILLVNVNIILIATLIARIRMKKLPFSISSANDKGKRSIITGMLTLIIPGVIGVVHYFLIKFDIVLVIFTIVSTLFLWLIYDSMRSLKWGNIES